MRGRRITKRVVDSLRPNGDEYFVWVDGTVQPNDITLLTDAKLLHAAIKRLTRLARKRGVRLRQSCARIAKRPAMMAGRYTHAKQLNATVGSRALGRLIRDIRRKIRQRGTRGGIRLATLAADQIRAQQQRQRGWKLYSFHAPEVGASARARSTRLTNLG